MCGPDRIEWTKMFGDVVDSKADLLMYELFRHLSPYKFDIQLDPEVPHKTFPVVSTRTGCVGMYIHNRPDA